jgi:peptidoglycan-associated lipoprotein
MPQTRRRATTALVLILASLAGACRKKPEAQPTPAPAPAPTAAGGGAAQPAPSAAAPSATPTGPTPAAIAEARATLEGAVYFEYDQDGLTDQARGLLDAKLAVLLANMDVQLRITGHADERGSDEYNIALGQRRAATVKRYFVDRGIADSKIALVSMGEEQPECMASEESCWQRNRRATFVITSGNISVAPRR